MSQTTLVGFEPFLAADFSGFLQFGLSSRADGQLRAFFCETNRRFPADPAAAAGDQRNFGF